MTSVRFVLIMGAALLASPALAASGYEGKWASNPGQCKLDQSVQNAPLLLKAKRYDQHEAHCTFASVTKTGAAAWRIKGRCTVEGSSQPLTMTLAVKGDTLTMRDVGTRTLKRCR